MSWTLLGITLSGIWRPWVSLGERKYFIHLCVQYLWLLGHSRSVQYYWMKSTEFEITHFWKFVISMGKSQKFILNFKIILSIYLLDMLGLRCCKGFSLVEESRGYSLVVVCRLLITVAFCCGPQALGCVGSVVVVRVLRCSVAYGFFPDQGSNTCLLHWQVYSLSLNHQGSPRHYFLNEYVCRWKCVGILWQKSET